MARTIVCIVVIGGVLYFGWQLMQGRGNPINSYYAWRNRSNAKFQQPV